MDLMQKELLRNREKIVYAPFIDQNVENFISEESKNLDVYAVDDTDNLHTILNQILREENLEDVIAVLTSESAPTVTGIISDVDVLNWIKRSVSKEEPIDNKEIAENIKNKAFFYVIEGQPLRKAIKKMSENKTTHVIVLDENKKYIGWVSRRSILKKINEMIHNEK